MDREHATHKQDISPQTAKPPGNRAYLIRCLGFALGVLLIVLLLKQAGYRTVLQRLSYLSVIGLLSAYGAYSLGWLMRTARLRLLTCSCGSSVPWLDLFLLRISAFALNNILPSKLGDVACVAFLRAKGLAVGRAFAILVHVRLMDLAALLAIAWLALFVDPVPLPGWLIVSILAGCLVVAIPLGVVLIKHRDFLPRMLQRLADRLGWPAAKLAAAKLTDAYLGFSAIARNHSLMGRSVLLSVAVWLCDILTAWLILNDLAQPMPFIVVCATVCIANIGKLLPLTPGGLGVYEGIFALVLSWYGVAFPLALTCGIIDHLVKKSLNLGIGLPAALTSGYGMWRGRKTGALDVSRSLH